MGKTLFSITKNYEAFSLAEKKIADFLLKNPQKILPYSITELADQCGCSEATIVRFSRKLGCAGYQQLKILIAQEENVQVSNEKITDKDSILDVYEKVASDIKLSLEKTKQSLNKKQLDKCCSILMSAKNIYIFGLGSSAPIAIDATHKFSRIGLNAFSCSDNHMQAIISSHVTKDDVVIGISHSGSSKDIVQAMKIAKEHNATTIAITNYGKSPIDKVSDYVLNTVSDEVNYNILGLNSRIAQLAIIDTLYLYIVCHSSSAKEFIKNTETALEQKKF